MDFEPIPDLVLDGYRLAPITLIEPGYEPSGDAWFLCPDGTHIDVYWEAEQSEDGVVWEPSTVEGGLGVIWVRCRAPIVEEADLAIVLRLAVSVATQPR